MIEFLGAVQDTDLAQYLRQSRWIYPFVNAGHILGIALLVGAVIPMDLALAGILKSASAAPRILRPFAATGLALAAVTGALLFLVQARDYLQLDLFWIKMALVVLATGNALAHAHLPVNVAPGTRLRVAAWLSLILWPTILICGRMIGYL